MENLSKRVLGNPKVYTRCGWQDKVYGGVQDISPGEKEIFIFHNKNKNMRSSCGSISWQVSFSENCFMGSLFFSFRSWTMLAEHAECLGEMESGEIEESLLFSFSLLNRGLYWISFPLLGVPFMCHLWPLCFLICLLFPILRL